MKYISTETFAEISAEMAALSVPEVEARLQEIMRSRRQFDSIELSAYLRSCWADRDSLPTWQPLLNASIEQARMEQSGRRDAVFASLMPDAQRPARNTDGMSGPRHPQMRKPK